MNRKCKNHVLLAVLGILILLLNTSPTLAYSNGMTKQDFVNFIGGRTINFDAMYHGGWTDKTPNIWITPGTYSIAYMHINSAGKLWYISISSNSITYGDESSNIITDTIPNDVFTAATNALAPYLIATYKVPAPTPTPYKAPAPTLLKTKQDFVNFIGGRTINFNTMYHGGWTDKTLNIWITPGTYSIAYMHINSAGKLWYISISSNSITYGDESSNILTDTIPNDVFTAATNALAPYLIATYKAPAPTPTPYKAPAPTPTPYKAPAPTPTPYTTPAPTQLKTKQDFVNFINGRIPNYAAMPQGNPSPLENNVWRSYAIMAEGTFIRSSDGRLWYVMISCYNPRETRCIWYNDRTAQTSVMTIPNDVFIAATKSLTPYLKNP